MGDYFSQFFMIFTFFCISVIVIHVKIHRECNEQILMTFHPQERSDHRSWPFEGMPCWSRKRGGNEQRIVGTYMKTLGNVSHQTPTIAETFLSLLTIRRVWDRAEGIHAFCWPQVHFVFI